MKQPFTGLLVPIFLVGGVLAAIPVAAQVKSQQKISDTEGTPAGFNLVNADQFGRAVANLGDIDADAETATTLVVGAFLDDTGGTDRGAVYVLFTRADGTVKDFEKIVGDDVGTLDDSDQFGFSGTSVGDLDGDAVPDLVVGAPFDDDGGTDRGAVWVLFLNADGSLKSTQKLSDTEGTPAGFSLVEGDGFGHSVASLGDLDSDAETVTLLAVGAPFDDTGGSGRGAVHLLALRADGTAKTATRLNGTDVGTANDDQFGFAAASPGDLDGDTVPDLAVGAPFDDTGGTDRGAVWLLRLHADATLASSTRLDDTDLPVGTLDNDDRWGVAVAGMGDLDGDAVPDLAVGSNRDDDGGAGTNANRGAAYLLTLNADGTVKLTSKISALNLAANSLDDGDFFGFALVSSGDLDADGVNDLLVGATGDDDGGSNRGAAWVIFLDGGALPVELVSFQALRDADTVYLSWRVASETGNAGFEVQRRAEGAQAWEPLGFVEGAGTTSLGRAYTYQVDHLLPGIYRFRLKQVDFDGAVAYSPEVEVLVNPPGAYLLSPVYPNPFNPTAQFNLTLTQTQHVRVEVVDLLGRTAQVLYAGQLEADRAHRFTVEGTRLASGTYALHVRGEHFHAVRTLTFVK